MSRMYRKRWGVIFRHGPVCCWCDRLLRYDECTIEHFIPVCCGGSDHGSNLRVACRDCNEARGLSSDPETIARMGNVRRMYRELAEAEMYLAEAEEERRRERRMHAERLRNRTQLESAT